MPFYLLLHATGAAFRLFFIATAGGVVISAYIFISLKKCVVYVCMCVCLSTIYTLLLALVEDMRSFVAIMQNLQIFVYWKY